MMNIENPQYITTFQKFMYPSKFMYTATKFTMFRWLLDAMPRFSGAWKSVTTVTSISTKTSFLTQRATAQAPSSRFTTV